MVFPKKDGKEKGELVGFVPIFHVSIGGKRRLGPTHRGIGGEKKERKNLNFSGFDFYHSLQPINANEKSKEIKPALRPVRGEKEERRPVLPSSFLLFCEASRRGERRNPKKWKKKRGKKEESARAPR